jgi:hypothetical protein
MADIGRFVSLRERIKPSLAAAFRCMYSRRLD